MVSRRSSTGGGRQIGCGGGQFGRGGGQISRGESSNSGGGGRERTEADRESSDRARVRASYRYLNYGRRPPPAYCRRESAWYQAALRGSSAASTSRAAQPQLHV